MTRTLLLVACLLPAVALAQAEELENPGTINAIQPRPYRMSHELTLGIGVLPLDAFYKGVMAQVAYSYHFSDTFAWQVGRAGYSYNLDSGLAAKLERDYGVLPTVFSEVQYFVGSDLIWCPLYGKGSWLNHSITHFEGYGVLGGSVFNLVNGLNHGSSVFRPGINLGIGVRLYSGRSISYRVDLTDNVLIASTGVSNVPTLQLSVALNFGPSP